MNEILSRSDEDVHKYVPAPDMYCLLREIEEADKKEGLRDQSKEDAVFQYPNMYRFLCHAAHGHMAKLRFPKNMMSHARWANFIATWALLLAVCHVAATDPKHEIESFSAHMLQMAEKARGAT